MRFQSILAVLVPVLASALVPVWAADRPNIVFILADDLGYETVGCLGGQSYQTPHLDRLAAGGIRFDRAYAMPLCTNTRIQLMTGKYNLRNWKAFGILDPLATTFGHALQQAGYKTCMAGKWQLTSYDPPDYPGAELRRDTGMRADQAGFDQYSLWHTGPTEVKGSRYADPVIDQDGQPLSDTKGKYGPDLWTDYIGEFMTRNQKQPFFVYYSMALPHNPMTPTPDSREWEDPQMRHQDQTRFARDMIEYTDKMVGKIVSQLEALNLREKTLVLFFSDNGTNSRVRSKFRGRIVGGEKGKASELGVRVPMIANWPGTIPPQQVSNALIDSVDFFPTLLDAAGVPGAIPQDADGISFLPVLKGESQSSREHVLIHQDPRPGWDKDRYPLVRVAINRDHKLYEDGRLIDLQADFFEQNPIWPTSDGAAERQARMKLQRVLESYSEYAMFDPTVVPRPDPNAHHASYAFQAAGNGDYVLCEAELFPFPRDESWVVENEAPGFTGLGYLRSIREQSFAGQSVESAMPGQTLVHLSIETEGEYQIAVRMRSDQLPSTEKQNAAALWRAVDESNWKELKTDKPSTGTWQWCSAGSYHLKEGVNPFVIAPVARNVKMDRVAVYRAEAQDKALNPATPGSKFHPWVKP